MYIEDLINVCSSINGVSLGLMDQKIIISLDNQILYGQSLTEKQANLAIMIIKKYKEKISKHIGTDIKPFLENPVYKTPFRTINSNKYIQIITDVNKNRMIKVTFPYDDNILNKIKSVKMSLFKSFWEKDEKSWYFSLEEQSIDFLKSLAEEFNFSIDDEFKILAAQINKVKENIEKYVPMAVFDQGKIKFVNTSQFLPENSSTDFLESIFYSKMAGVLTWDDAIEEQISKLPYPDDIKKIIKNDPGIHVDINLENTPLSALSSIIKYLFPCLVVIPNDKELIRLEQNYDFFKSVGVNDNEMSVLFRLPNETGKDFNEFVKINKLNSPLTNNTKVIFISTQIPKTILGNKLEINSVLNYNYYHAHYKIRDFLKFKINVINILDRGPQRSSYFAKL